MPAGAVVARTSDGPRHVGTIEPAWNLFELMPPGRGVGRDEQLDDHCCH